MRRAAHVDENQVEIVRALRKAGASVQHLHAVGAGCPDVIAGHRGVNYLLEIKDGEKPPSRRRLNPEQERFHRLWAGQVATVKNVSEALRVVFKHKG